MPKEEKAWRAAARQPTLPLSHAVAAWPNSRRGDLKPVLSLWAITLPAEPETAVLAQIRASCRGFPSKPSPDDTCQRDAALADQVIASAQPSPAPSTLSKPASRGSAKVKASEILAGQSRFSHGRLEFADAVLELNDMLGRSRRGRDGWREKCEDAKHRHQKLQKLWTATGLAGRPDTDSDWPVLARGVGRGDLRSRRQRKGRAAF